MPPRIVVVGSSNTDFVVRAPRIPGPGETVLGDTFYRAAGGKGANQAVAAARLGAAVSLVARVGDDELGRAALAGYRAEGIDVEGVVVDPDAPSGIALIVVDEAGENAITVAPGANDRLCEADVERSRAAIEAADVLLLQLETPLAATARAIEIARAAGAKVILNPAPARPLASALLVSVDVLTPNRSETAELVRALGGAAGERDLAREARSLVEAGARLVVVTLGAEGVLRAERDGVARYAALPANPVDTTGAGDAFNGAFAVAWAEGSGVEAAIERAQRAAAWSVGVAGAQPSLPTAADLA